MPHPLLQSLVVFAAFACALAIPWRGKSEEGAILSRDRTEELRGAGAILIIFAHIGYYLVQDHSFLFPLSTFAGTAVNLFLFLSGYGLTASALARTRSPLDFYRRHAKKLYIPLWIMLAALFAADFILLGRSYDWHTMLFSFLGYFPHADLFADVNSPLWYLTLTFALYAVFPLVFSRRYPWLSAGIIAGLSYAAVLYVPQIQGVAHLWKEHTLAFPLGMMAAWVLLSLVPNVCVPSALRSGIVLRGAVIALACAALYLTLHASIGTPAEQYMSLLTLAALILLFVIKRHRSAFLMLVGSYSYEMYLLHWPLLSRYDALYRVLPASAATILSIAIIIGLAMLLRHAASISEHVIWKKRRNSYTQA